MSNPMFIAIGYHANYQRQDCTWEHKPVVAVDIDEQGGRAMVISERGVIVLVDDPQMLSQEGLVFANVAPRGQHRLGG